MASFNSEQFRNQFYQVCVSENTAGVPRGDLVSTNQDDAYETRLWSLMEQAVGQPFIPGDIEWHEARTQKGTVLGSSTTWGTRKGEINKISFSQGTY